MDKRTDVTYLRIPSKMKNMIDSYSRKKGLRITDAIVHLIAKGLWIEDSRENYHIEQYTENFFSDGDRIVRDDDKND